MVDAILKLFGVLDFEPRGSGHGDMGDQIYSDALVLAPATAKCSHCREQIKVGEQIRERHCKEDGREPLWRWCSACSEAMTSELRNEMRSETIGDPLPFWRRSVSA